MKRRGVPIAGAVAGAVIGAPVGFLIWLGAEHGGRGPITILVMAVLGAGFGLVIANLVAPAIRLLRRFTARGRPS